MARWRPVTVPRRDRGRVRRRPPLPAYRRLLICCGSGRHARHLAADGHAAASARNLAPTANGQQGMHLLQVVAEYGPAYDMLAEFDIFARLVKLAGQVAALLVPQDGRDDPRQAHGVMVASSRLSISRSGHSYGPLPTSKMGWAASSGVRSSSGSSSSSRAQKVNLRRL